VRFHTSIQSVPDFPPKHLVALINRLNPFPTFSVAEGLESLYKQYKDQGFTIIGFPCNQFGWVSVHGNLPIPTCSHLATHHSWQESGTDDEIASFCKMVGTTTGSMDIRDTSDNAIFPNV